MSKTILSLFVLVLCVALVSAYGGRRSAPAPVRVAAPAPVAVPSGWGRSAPVAAPVHVAAPVVRGGWGRSAPVAAPVHVAPVARGGWGRSAPVHVAAPVARGGWGRSAPVRSAPVHVASGWGRSAPVRSAPVRVASGWGRGGKAHVSGNACEVAAFNHCGSELTTTATACRAVQIANCQNPTHGGKSSGWGRTTAVKTGGKRRGGIHIGPIHIGGGKRRGGIKIGGIHIGGKKSGWGRGGKRTGGTPVTSPSPAGDLGFLSQLPGKWVGEGMNMVALPNYDSPNPTNYRVSVQKTKEIFDFAAIGGAIANRGSSLNINNHARGQKDIFYHGVTYMQDVSDLHTGEGLHVEPGVFLNVPATDVNPVHNATVVRMGSIPHGNVIHCESDVLLTTDVPSFDVLDTTPTGPITNFLVPITQAHCPAGITPEMVKNPNIMLQQQIAGQNIISTTVISVSSKIEGRVSNIPYIIRNAEATDIDSIFWIETVRNADGSTFLQMQYTQTVFLKFLGSVFPHTTVATLRKQ